MLVHVEKELLIGVMNYLANRPYAEVHNYLGALAAQIEPQLKMKSEPVEPEVVNE